MNPRRAFSKFLLLDVYPQYRVFKAPTHNNRIFSGMGAFHITFTHYVPQRGYRNFL